MRTQRSTTQRWPIGAGTELGPVHLSVTDGTGLFALRGGEPVVQTPQHRDKAITLTLLGNVAGLTRVPPFRERSKP